MAKREPPQVDRYELERRRQAKAMADVKKAAAILESDRIDEDKILELCELFGVEDSLQRTMWRKDEG